MNKKYFKIFFIFSFILISLLYIFKIYFIQIYLLGIKKVHQYSLMLKNNTQIYKLIFEYQKLKKDYNEIKFLKKELDEYKKYISNGNTFNKNFLLAEIIGYVNNKKTKFIIINRGSVDNIIENMIVVDNSNCILGKITEVYDYYSKITLLDNPNQYISVTFENNIEAIIQGNRNETEKTMKVIHIYNHQNKNIKPKTLVFSSGKGLLFPAGYLIGNIIEKNLINYLDYQIIIQNDYDIENSQYCYIIIPTNLKKNIEFFLQNKTLWDPLYVALKKNNLDNIND